MGRLERQDVVVAAVGVVALLVGLGSLILVGVPATSMMEPAVGGHGGMGGPGGMAGRPVAVTPVGWLAVFALSAAVVAFGYVARGWGRTGRSARASKGSDTETERIEAIRSAYARGELTDSELDAALDRELGGDEVRERRDSTAVTREHPGVERIERE